MSRKEKVINNIEEEESGFDMRKYLSSCASKWQLFVVSILVICSLGVFYVFRQEPKYMRSEQILVKNEDSGGSTDMIANSFNQMGLGSSATNVYNELITFQSPALMAQVVKRLDLDNNYVLKGFPHNISLYGTTAPFKVIFEDITDVEGASFHLNVRPDGTACFEELSLVRPGEKRKKFKENIEIKSVYGTFRTPVGRITIERNPLYKPGALLEKDVTYVVTHAAMQPTIQTYSNRLKADLVDKDAEVIELSIMDVNVERASDILSAIVDVYKEDWVEDRNRIAQATARFIDERLLVIEEELGSVDSDITEYKSRISNPNIEESARAILQSNNDVSSNIVQTSNMLSMTEFMREYINNPANDNSVIPANTGIQSAQLEQQIGTYNEMLLLRNSLVETTSPSNPMVKDYDQQLKGMRESIKRAVESQVSGLKKSLSNLYGAKGEIREQLSTGPRQSKYLLSVERQQKVMEELYIFLLQKREENQLSQKFTADNIRVITPPYGSLLPVSPKKGMILGIAFLLSLLIPAGIVYIKETSDNKVRSRHDLEKMSAPFVGEIPMVGGKNYLAKLRDKFSGSKKGKKKLESLPVKVQSGSRDMINESFRIVRSNLDLILKSVNGPKVIMMTSFNPGSGKSFITFNLAASFAIKQKKALVIDCDLRHGSSSQFVGMPSRGLSNYLTGSANDWSSLVVPVKETPGLYVMPIGHRPPNPAELLDNGRIGELLKSLETEFDYIFLDCPPIDVVADTQIIEKYASQTIFVVRAGLLERKAVAEIDEMYSKNRFSRMCIVLNGTDRANSRYGTYGSQYYNSDF